MKTTLPPSVANQRQRWQIDGWLSRGFAVLALASALIVLLVFGFLLWQTLPMWQQGRWLRFLADPAWYPLEGLFGAWPMIVASVLVVLLAICMALPIGIASALFHCYYAPRRVADLNYLGLVLLAATPSVVLGLWGLTVIVPLLAQWQPPATSLLTAALVLSVMIVPTIALTSIASLQALPSSLRHAAAAVGLSRPTEIIAVLLPAARQGIFAGVVLAIARAFGETMAVLMVAGNVVQIPNSVFDPVRVLTANIALEMAYATGQHRTALYMSGLLLMLLVSTLSLLVAWHGRRAQHGQSHD